MRVVCARQVFLINRRLCVKVIYTQNFTGVPLNFFVNFQLTDRETFGILKLSSFNLCLLSLWRKTTYYIIYNLKFSEWECNLWTDGLPFFFNAFLLQKLFFSSLERFMKKIFFSVSLRKKKLMVCEEIVFPPLPISTSSLYRKKKVLYYYNRRMSLSSSSGPPVAFVSTTNEWMKKSDSILKWMKLLKFSISKYIQTMCSCQGIFFLNSFLKNRMT